METFLNIRKSLGLTQIEIAKELGVRQSTVSRLENGQPMDRRTEMALVELRRRKNGSAYPHGVGAISQSDAAAQSNMRAVLDTEARA